ncbi:iron-sulfur cluster assembly protein, partial [Cytobacillus oceanisediminis]|uniref:metal-sulfur cluster assembly factor n=1 Tax=Cytobacillus oceanisediminis TaxID=665099 RepID=UPI0011A992D1
IRENLKSVYDGELKMNVVDLGVIYDIEVGEGRSGRIVMRLRTGGCRLHESIGRGIKYCVEGMEEIEEGDVELRWEGGWGGEGMREDGK